MKRFDQINVIPFIDIMLVLLAIVLTTASFISTGQIKINLPEAETTFKPSETEIIELVIDEQQTIWFRNAQIGIDDLRSEVTKFDKDANVQLRVDEHVNFGTFVTVMDMLKARGMEKLAIITKHKQ